MKAISEAGNTGTVKMSGKEASDTACVIAVDQLPMRIESNLEEWLDCLREVAAAAFDEPLRVRTRKSEGEPK
jgi:hypothetical protein